MAFLVLRNYCALQHFDISYCESHFSLLKNHAAMQQIGWLKPPSALVVACVGVPWCVNRS